jgi:hypothetical protein
MNVATWTIKDKNGISGTMECKNNWIVNNTIYNSDSYSIRLDRSDAEGDVTTLKDNQIHNNLLLNWGLDTTYVIDPEHSNPPVRMGLRILNSVSSGVTFFRNNNFWIAWDTSSIRPVALYKTKYYNAAQLNNCAECGPGNVTGNTQLNPQLGNFYNLTSNSSAFLRSGGYSYRSGIAASGLPSAEFVDYYGKPWPELSISVGAIQY